MTEQQDEWGPWIDHDGKGCPCVGQYVNFVHRDGFEQSGIAGEGARRFGKDVNGPDSPWVWPSFYDREADIIRYRIRKPRAMSLIKSWLEDLPERIDA